MDNIGFITTGDWGSESLIYSINKKNMEKQRNINFNILLGDNFYPSGVESIHDKQWKTMFETTFDKPCFPVLGNHDYVLNPNAQIMYSKTNDNWKMPFYYYDMILHITEKESAHFIFIDTCLIANDITHTLLTMCNTNQSSIVAYNQLLFSYTNKQKKWLRDVLHNSKSKWKIVCGHYPVYSNGPHILSRQLQQFLVPLFDQYKVDFYISGHDHNLQHIYKNKTNYIIAGAFCNYQSMIHQSFLNIGTRYISQMGGFVRFDVNLNNITVKFIGTNNMIIYSYSTCKL